MIHHLRQKEDYIQLNDAEEIPSGENGNWDGTNYRVLGNNCCSFGRSFLGISRDDGVMVMMGCR